LYFFVVLSTTGSGADGTTKAEHGTGYGGGVGDERSSGTGCPNLSRITGVRSEPGVAGRNKERIHRHDEVVERRPEASREQTAAASGGLESPSVDGAHPVVSRRWRKWPSGDSAAAGYRRMLPKAVGMAAQAATSTAAKLLSRDRQQPEPGTGVSSGKQERSPRTAMAHRGPKDGGFSGRAAVIRQRGSRQRKSLHPSGPLEPLIRRRGRWPFRGRLRVPSGVPAAAASMSVE